MLLSLQSGYLESELFVLLSLQSGYLESELFVLLSAAYLQSPERVSRVRALCALSAAYLQSPERVSRVRALCAPQCCLPSVSRAGI